MQMVNSVKWILPYGCLLTSGERSKPSVGVSRTTLGLHVAFLDLFPLMLKWAKLLDSFSVRHSKALLLRKRGHDYTC